MKSLSSLPGTFRHFQAHIVMAVVQFAYPIMFFISEAAFDHGLNPQVYTTYRLLIGGLVILPFAYILERNTRPELTLALFMEIFIISLLGGSLSLNMLFASLPITSPTFLTSMVNTVPCMTFLLAFILRLEIIDFGDPRGIAKVVGTLLSLAGVLILTLYKGAALKSSLHPIVNLKGKAEIHEKWLLGSVMIVASCISWSFVYIIQAYTLKRYPAKLSLAAWVNIVGGAQSAVYTVIVQHKKSAWTIGFNIELWSTLYGGVVISGLIFFVQLWCTKQKGPVFVTMFNPLSTLLVAVMSYFAIGEKLYVGSLIGGAVVIFGLYLLLWGKEGDQKKQVKSDEEISTKQDDGKKHNISSDLVFQKEP